MGKFLDETGLSTLVTNIKTALGKKQDKLTSGTNIKTVNRHSLLGSGDVTVGDVTQDGNNSFSGTNKFYGSLGIGTSLVFVNGEAPILTINGQGGGSLELVDNVNADPVTIKNVESPVQGTDAANKSYVDTQINSISSSPVILDFTGLTTFNSDSANYIIITKSIYDRIINNYPRVIVKVPSSDAAAGTYKYSTSIGSAFEVSLRDATTGTNLVAMNMVSYPNAGYVLHKASVIITNTGTEYRATLSALESAPITDASAVAAQLATI